MLSIHTGLWKSSKTYFFILKKKNPFDIIKPCIKIAKSELLFEQYRMAINQDKYYTEVQYDDAIKRNQILFDFMQQTFNYLDGLYMHEKCILIDTIREDQ